MMSVVLILPAVYSLNPLVQRPAFMRGFMVTEEVRRVLVHTGLRCAARAEAHSRHANRAVIIMLLTGQVHMNSWATGEYNLHSGPVWYHW